MDNPLLQCVFPVHYLFTNYNECTRLCFVYGIANYLMYLSTSEGQFILPNTSLQPKKYIAAFSYPKNILRIQGCVCARVWASVGVRIEHHMPPTSLTLQVLKYVAFSKFWEHVSSHLGTDLWQQTSAKRNKLSRAQGNKPSDVCALSGWKIFLDCRPRGGLKVSSFLIDYCSVYLPCRKKRISRSSTTRLILVDSCQTFAARAETRSRGLPRWDCSGPCVCWTDNTGWDGNATGASGARIGGGKSGLKLKVFRRSIRHSIHMPLHVVIMALW